MDPINDDDVEYLDVEEYEKQFQKKGQKKVDPAVINVIPYFKVIGPKNA